MNCFVSCQPCIQLHILGSIERVLTLCGYFQGGLCSFLFPAQRLVGPLNWSGNTRLLLTDLLRPDKHSNHSTFTGKAQTSNMLHFRWEVIKFLWYQVDHWNTEFILRQEKWMKWKLAVNGSYRLLHSTCLCSTVKIFEDISLKIIKGKNCAMCVQLLLGGNKSIDEDDHSVSA